MIQAVQRSRPARVFLALPGFQGLQVFQRILWVQVIQGILSQADQSLLSILGIPACQGPLGVRCYLVARERLSLLWVQESPVVLESSLLYLVLLSHLDVQGLLVFLAVQRYPCLRARLVGQTLAVLEGLSLPWAP